MPARSRVIDIDMTDAVADPSLKGQAVQATLTVNDVKKLRLPELTHEFLHNFGLHTPEQFHEYVHVLWSGAWNMNSGSRPGSRFSSN